MMIRILLTVATLAYALAVPILEINSSHVFNPDWTPHARIHEVWQLITNSALGVFALWLIWGRGEHFVPALLGALITGGFLAALALQDFYGGSMKYLEGTEKTLFGVNIGLLGFGIAFAIFVFALTVGSRTAPSETPPA